MSALIAAYSLADGARDAACLMLGWIGGQAWCAWRARRP